MMKHMYSRYQTMSLRILSIAKKKYVRNVMVTWQQWGITGEISNFSGFRYSSDASLELFFHAYHTTCLSKGCL